LSVDLLKGLERGARTLTQAHRTNAFMHNVLNKGT